MDQLSPVSMPQRSRLALMVRYGLPVALLLLVGAFFAIRAWSASQPAPNADVVPTNPAVEDRWGVRVSQIGVTADGGLVDFRYVVIDPDKALAMVQDVNNWPVLIAEDTGTVVNSAGLMAAKHSLAAGRTYFMLYRNTRGAIKPGGAVTVKFGDLQLEHVVAK